MRESQTDWIHGELTERIIGTAIDVIGALGSGYLESVYQRSMMIALTDAGLPAQEQVPMTIHFRGYEVGFFKCDIIVDGKVLLELKATKGLTAQDQAKVINYLKGTGLRVGLLINFGRPRLEWRRLHP